MKWKDADGHYVRPQDAAPIESRSFTFPYEVYWETEGNPSPRYLQFITTDYGYCLALDAFYQMSHGSKYYENAPEIPIECNPEDEIAFEV